MLDFIKVKYPSIVKNALSKYVVSCIGVYNNYLYYTKDKEKEKKEILKIVKDNYTEAINNKELAFSRKAQIILVCKFNLLYRFIIKLMRKIKDNKSK